VGDYYSASYNSARFRVLNKYLQIYSEKDKGLLEIFSCPGDRPDWPIFERYGNSYIWNHNLASKKLSSIKLSFTKIRLARDSLLMGSHGGRRPYQKVIVLFLDGHVNLHNYNADWIEHGGTEVTDELEY